MDLSYIVSSKKNNNTRIEQLRQEIKTLEKINNVFDDICRKHCEHKNVYIEHNYGQKNVYCNDCHTDI